MRTSQSSLNIARNYRVGDAAARQFRPSKRTDGVEDKIKVAVVMASLGRAAELAHALAHLADQTQPPSLIILSLEKPEDAPSYIPAGVEVVMGPRGLCAQRNRGLRALGDRADVVAFFDDDYVPSRTAIEGIARTFAAHPDVVGATGQVLADGVGSGGVEYEEAKQIVEVFDVAALTPTYKIKDVDSAYGCNMAFRTRAIQDLAFDEKLPLYGWQEDVDFAGQVRRKGRMIITDAFSGVHCGVTRSRMPGKRLGFSQVVNCVYLMRKGSMTPAHGIIQVSKNVLANHVKALAPEEYVDRRGRAMGNWLGLAHVIAGRADPMAVLQL